MPVLDAKALERDPKGAAFLLSILRDGPCCRANPLGQAGVITGPRSARSRSATHRDPCLVHSGTGDSNPRFASNASGVGSLPRKAV
jgi:hypothetical protein